MPRIKKANPTWVKLVIPSEDCDSVMEWEDKCEDYGEDEYRNLKPCLYIVERHGDKYYWTNLTEDESFTTCEYPESWSITEVPISQLGDKMAKGLRNYELRKEFFSHVVKDVKKNVGVFKRELALA